jgi:hypothetical protein
VAMQRKVHGIYTTGSSDVHLYADGNVLLTVLTALRDNVVFRHKPCG